MFPGFPKKSWAQSPRDHLLRQHLKISTYHAHPLGLRPALRAVLLGSEPFTLDLRAHILSYLLSMPRMQPPETEPNTPVMQAGRGQTGCLSRVAQQGRSGTADTGAPAADTPCSLAGTGCFQIPYRALGDVPAQEDSRHTARLQELGPLTCVALTHTSI